MKLWVARVHALAETGQANPGRKMAQKVLFLSSHAVQKARALLGIAAVSVRAGFMASISEIIVDNHDKGEESTYTLAAASNPNGHMTWSVHNMTSIEALEELD